MKIERKLVVIGLACLLISVGIGSVFAVTRTISDTGDTVDTFIRNSKGNYWDWSTANANNIQLAIWDLNGTVGGWVSLPGGVTTNTSKTILLENCSLYMNGAKIYVTANVNGIEPRKNRYATQGKIEIIGGTIEIADSIQATYSHAAIYINSRWVWYQAYNLYITNMQIFGDDTGWSGYCLHGYGIEITNQTGTDVAGNCFGVVMDECSITAFKYGIYISAPDNGVDNGLNGNRFSNIYINNCVVAMVIEGYSGYVDQNFFDTIIVQAVTWSEEAIRVNWGGFNVFKNILLMDIDIFINQSSLVNISLGAHSTYIDCDQLQMDNVRDHSGDVDPSKVSLINTGQSIQSINISAVGHSYATASISAANINPFGHFGYAGSVPKWSTYFFSRIPIGNPVSEVRVYGSPTGYLGLLAYSVYSDSGKITWRDNGGIGISNDTITIDDILKLTPRTTTPTSPSAGMIYYNGTDNNLYLYTTGWHTIDIT